MIDQILQPYQGYSRTYVDDIGVYAKTLSEHLSHLNTILQRLSELNIALKFRKSLIDYPSIKLPSQKVNVFGLSMTTEELRAISKLEFLKSLKQLKIYLGMTGYLRQYIPFYAQVSASLQASRFAPCNTASFSSSGFQAATYTSVLLCVDRSHVGPCSQSKYLREEA